MTAQRLFIPLNPCQALVRRLSVINLENFRRQYARRRWKMSIRIVSLCNHLTRMMRRGQEQQQQQQDQRSCDSDNEEETRKTRLQTRKRSNTS
ncbi:death-associated protein kinase 2-like [Oncorhynchus clarkii lewisi]|uniref:death-associated protein kinase 2-like n=1 Tax=Oncorhynchus clarkii lewisi TaxID=490388 RepID=UPI0039B8B761